MGEVQAFQATRRGLLRAAGALGILSLAGASGVRAQDARVRVAAAYTVPVEQQWVSRIHKAAQEAQAAGLIDYVFTQSVANTGYARVLREHAEGGHHLILGEIFGIEQEARKVAAGYPGVAFLMGSLLPPDPAVPNLAVFDNYIQDASYLSGIIAGAMTRSGNIGMVGGFPIPEVNRLMNTFMAGIRETRPDARFQISFIGSWFDPPKARQTALRMIEAGADLLYAERFGVSDAAREKGVLAIGNVIDTQAEYPDTVVTSALWDFGPTLKAALAAVRAGTFRAEDYGRFSFMKEGGAMLAPLGTFEGKVPAEAMAKVEERRLAIMEGSFEVEIDDSEPTSS